MANSKFVKVSWDCSAHPMYVSRSNIVAVVVEDESRDNYIVEAHLKQPIYTHLTVYLDDINSPEELEEFLNGQG